MGWPSFSVHGRSVRRVEGAYAGMVERTYAGDVTSVRAGLRRRILLRLRESAKIIVPGAELAFGSNSSPWHNNADSRSPSSITPPPHRSIQTKVNTLPSSTTKNSLKKAQGCAEGRGLVPLCGFLFHKKIAPTSQRCKS